MTKLNIDLGDLQVEEIEVADVKEDITKSMGASCTTCVCTCSCCTSL